MPPDASRGSLLLLPGVFHALGGIERFNRNLVRAFLSGVPGATRAIVLRDRPDQVRGDEWRGVEHAACSGRRVAFTAASLSASRRGPARIVIGHRNFLVLAPLLRFVAPRSERWLILHGVDAWNRLSPLERLARGSVDRAFAVSPQTGAAFRAAGYSGPVEIWPNCLPFDAPVPAATPPRFVPPCRLLAVTRLAAADRYKGIGDILEAMARLDGRPEQIKLDVVGDGDDRARLQARAVSLGLAGAVRFHGAVSDAERERLYAACDLFVLPSTGEGFGIVYLEALAHAKPVIAADAGGAPFVVRPGVSGFLVPPRQPEALALCIADRIRAAEESRHVGRSGRELALREFSFEAFLARTREIVGVKA